MTVGAFRRARAASTVATFSVEAERVVAWLRLPAIVLIAVGGGLGTTNDLSDPAFFVSLLVYVVGAVLTLVFVYLRPVGVRFALATVAFDVGAITALTLSSGGPFSQTRVAYFLVPIVAAFRFRPAVTAAATGAAVLAYVVQALTHPAAGQPQALRFTAVHAGYLVWAGGAATVLSALLRRRAREVWDLVEVRESLLRELLSAEERERQTLAETVHDHSLQNLLSIRHELEEAAERHDCEPLGRADRIVVETVRELRELVATLHPYVLEEAGLAAALRLAADRAARRGGFSVGLDIDAAPVGLHDRLLVGAARELLANAAAHASARRVTLKLEHLDGEVRLRVSDDGVGFDAERLSEQLAEGHIGLASQRLRVESAGGEMTIVSARGAGTTVLIRLPIPPEPTASTPRLATSPESIPSSMTRTARSGSR